MFPFRNAQKYPIGEILHGRILFLALNYYTVVIMCYKFIFTNICNNSIPCDCTPILQTRTLRLTNTNCLDNWNREQVHANCMYLKVVPNISLGKLIEILCPEVWTNFLLAQQPCSFSYIKVTDHTMVLHRVMSIRHDIILACCWHSVHDMFIVIIIIWIMSFRYVHSFNRKKCYI